MNIINFFFPKLDKISYHEQVMIGDRVGSQMEKIRDLKFTGSLDYLFEEIKKIDLMQEDRTKVAQDKAWFCLIFPGSILPILAFMATQQDSVFHNIALALPLMYLLTTSYFIFKTLSIEGYHKIYISDIFKLSGKENLARLYLENILKDQQVRNEKIDYLNLTQEYLKRTFFALGLLILAHMI